MNEQSATEQRESPKTKSYLENTRSLAVDSQSPSFTYNLAILEAFQRSCKEVRSPEQDKNERKGVIFLGGSFGRGTATIFSDFDVRFVGDGKVEDVLEQFGDSDSELGRLVRNSIVNIGREMANLLKEPRYYSARVYFETALMVHSKISKKKEQHYDANPILTETILRESLTIQDGRTVYVGENGRPLSIEELNSIKERRQEQKKRKRQIKSIEG